MRKFALALAACGVAFIAFIVAFALTENARGRKAWEAWKRSRQAMGDSYEWAPLLPPPVPDEENFAKVPEVAAACRAKSPESLLGKDPFKIPKTTRSWMKGQEADLAAWLDALQAKDIDTGLEKVRPALDRLAEASRRPRSNLGLDHEHGEVPGLLGFRAAARALSIRAVANLRAGRTDAALADVLTCLKVAEHMNPEPELICHLLQVAVVQIALQPVWEGLTTHRWTESQLQVLQAELGKPDLLGSYRKSMGAERLRMTRGLLCRIDPSLYPYAEDENPWKGKPLPKDRFFNQGYIYRNVITIDRYFAEGFIDAVDPARRRVYPERYERVRTWADALGKTPYTMWFLALRSGLEKEIARTARASEYLDEAMLACALERFRLQTHRYPDALAELVPAFVASLPRDVATGGSLQYRRADGDGFILYSVGWNGRDEGGAVYEGEEKVAGESAMSGDWVWPRAADLGPGGGR